ncbi:MAG: BrnT family toxin [Anaerolineae bacterium]|nr:BrnT family toxin [Anaerolineae bacterium]
MHTTYTLQDILFEWDSHKAASNLDKHGISFELACEVFFDPFLLVMDDEEEYVDGELREKVVGITVDWRLLYVVYVMREDRIRLVSARYSTSVERKRYENG